MAYELHRTPHPRRVIAALPALPDALEERHEVPRDLVLLVLEADGPLAVRLGGAFWLSRRVERDTSYRDAIRAGIDDTKTQARECKSARAALILCAMRVVGVDGIN